ncbi:hypothetical protein KUTeg_022463 [Tegillarca granosa]|uniref:GH18 domain-containing protein n=1 Tax=Tegillarca granosa TaxID=220873 RepID=A0ABQ9E949_TEGGR|nr:hypothetical protein KUTeg_022463 [Tegillarca granosa]
MFVMSYDEQSQIFGPCVAGANSGYYKTLKGIQYYRDLDIPAKKLVLGIPWYGYVYKCLNVSKGGYCAIEKVPYHGANCSDAAGKEKNYGDLMEILKTSTTGRIWEDSTLTPYFNFKKGNVTYQVRYDDLESLTLKYTIAMTYQLRGVGMWNADALNYTSNDPEVIRQTRQMWQALPEYETFHQTRYRPKFT